MFNHIIRIISIYFELVYLVTAFVPSLTACLANSPGNNRRTDVWISRLEIVERPLWLANLDSLDPPISGCHLGSKSSFLVRDCKLTGHWNSNIE